MKPEQQTNLKFAFAIDRGGTFTDVFVRISNGKVRVLKLLSVDPDNYKDAPTEGIRRILEEETGIAVSKNQPINGSCIEWIRMGTTIATNALLERKGERMALLINKGFKDLLYIGNQARPKIFDLSITMPEMLYEEVVEVDCKVVPRMRERCRLADANSWPVIKGLNGEEFLIKEKLNEEKLMEDLRNIKNKGINSIAVVLLHSYTCIDDEIKIGNLAKSLGFQHVCLSHEVMPMVRIVNRGFTTCADAYLTPHIKKYVKEFCSGFRNDLKDVNVLFMKSDGGLTPMNDFIGSRAILSGPAGGVVGYSMTTPGDKPVIGFDMGGTSTDVSRYHGSYDHVFENITAGINIQAPQLDIQTVAAGGGSRLFFRSGLFFVGPKSAGAHPGPICYRKNGFLTITDANLILGRIIPEYFPSIFGPNEDQPLDKEASFLAFKSLTAKVNSYLKEGNLKKMSIEEVAMGFIQVANETMCRPIRSITEGKGFDTQTHVLACFGGAGGQHACAIARELGISTVAIHKYAGILSAYGMSCADVECDFQESCNKSYMKDNLPYLNQRFKILEQQNIDKLTKQGFSKKSIVVEPFLNMRYDGTDGTLITFPVTSEDEDNSTSFGDFKESFIKRYQNEYGFTLLNKDIIVDDIGVRGRAKTDQHNEQTMELSTSPPPIEATTKVYFSGSGFTKCNIYISKVLRYGHKIEGPAVIIDDLSTIIVEPDCRAVITETGDILIEIKSLNSKMVSTVLNTIQLSIFSHRFMSIAEQMGRILQRTSISTNIKERLDFSCALFGPDGGLVSNAPHIPVHLGAMQAAVQYQMETIGNEIKEGDVILTNHPLAGGSHLPDLTVITPVFYKNEAKPIFFVASRGHHADIGGITPGSMPPHSKSLTEEGATFKSFFLVRNGEFKEKELTEELMKPGKTPGCSGTRNLRDNIADLKAQIAANHKGIRLVQELINSYGLDVVQAYMNYIQSNAEEAVKDMLRNIAYNKFTGEKTSILSAIDYLDDGSPIQVKAHINIKDGTAVFDFSDSGYEVWGNCNAPRAITLSALIYCLRCMVGHDVPLNQGCLNPIKTIIPEGTILNPSENAAVVGGNVQTSQRIVDVILKAFKACAASQGCMNNITFGQEDWGYYETVAGGAGAGPTWSGRSGVHTHMTNTRITDPEILERRYPVILERFTLRKGSGGDAFNKGGDGVERFLKFRDKITLSILTERRVFHPYGINGGSNGAKGLNILSKSDGRKIYLGSKCCITTDAGDVFELYTPGGGGWGSNDKKEKLT